MYESKAREAEKFAGLCWEVVASCLISITVAGICYL